MAVTFCFLGAKTYQCQEGQLKGEGGIQTSGLKEILTLRSVIRGVFVTGTGCRQKEALCLEVTFDTKIHRGLSEASGPAGVILGGGMAQEGWPKQDELLKTHIRHSIVKMAKVKEKESSLKAAR